MDGNLKTNEMIEKLIDENTVKTIGNEYWEHIEYVENRNTLIYCGRAISVLIVIVIAINLLINKIKKKKNNKILITFFIIFIIMTVVAFLLKIMPV